MFKFAIKNIIFYNGRSITTFILTFISTILFIIYVSLMDGSHKSMLENSLKIYSGAIEIYHKDYRDIGGDDYLIDDVKLITDNLSNIKGITTYSPRYETYGLLSNQEYSSASMIVGINPQTERELTLLDDSLIKGKFLDVNSTNLLYMGVNLAKKLKLDIGNEVAFIGSASDGSFASDIFIVSGIFKTGLFDFDNSLSFINKSYLDSLMYLQNSASYIAIKIDNLENVDKINQEILKKLDTNNYESLTWKSLMSAMVEMLKVDSIFGYISLSLFFVVIFFVIMIYGFINVTSRIKEFGVLMAIGLSSYNIKKLLFYEMFIISTLSILIATPIGAYISYYFSIHPIVIDGISQTYKEYGIVSDEMPLSFDIFTISWNILTIYILNFLSIIYPLKYINSFRPIEAINHV